MDYTDFTRKNYRKLLQLAKMHYQFCHYTEIPQQEQFVLWRHDVDFSMHAARKLASIEAEEGISATYFLLLHSEFYNLLEREIVACVKEIIDLGHQIGLHIDTSFYDCQSEALLENILVKEKTILEMFFDKKISVFSFHNPSAFNLTCRKWQYAGMINCYADYFQQAIDYCSDSNGYWRFHKLDDVLNDHKKSLQVLTHPEWWTDKAMSPRDRVMRAIEGRAKNVKVLYDRLLADNGRMNIGKE